MRSQVHLVAQHSPNGASLIVSADPQPGKNITMTLDEFRTFRLFMFYLFQTINKKSSDSSIRKLTTTRDALSNVLCFLYADIARFVAPATPTSKTLTSGESPVGPRPAAENPALSSRPPSAEPFDTGGPAVEAGTAVVAPELSEYGQMEDLSLACYGTNTVVPAADYQATFNLTAFQPKKWTTYGRDFFDASFALKINVLSNAALNADLAMVKRILEKSSPEQCKLLLSTIATATISHLNIERKGTPLQMAIYDHDEEMIGFFKEQMDPAEFQCQWVEVVGPDYPVFLKKQESEAEALCSELEDAFIKVGAKEITCDDSYVASTTCEALHNTLKRFKDGLEQYVRKNPVHNPTILARVYKIYEQLPPSLNMARVYKIYEQLPPSFKRDCLFSQQVIGFVQSKMSARWLQHYAQGIVELTEYKDPAQRSFGCHNSRPVVDVRHLVSSRGVGRDGFLTLSERGNGGGRWAPLVGDPGSGSGAGRLTKLMSIKNNKLGPLMRQLSHKQDQCLCIVS